MRTQSLTLAGLLAAGTALAVPPDILPIPDYNIQEDMTLTVDVEVIDPDSEHFLYWASSSTSSVIVSFDEVNMQVHITPLSNWNGTVEILVGADDLDELRNSDVESFEVVVEPVNDCPVPLTPFPDIQIFEDEHFLLTRAALYAHVTDPDLAYEGDSLFVQNLSYTMGEFVETDQGWLFGMGENTSGIGQVTFNVSDGSCSVQCAFLLDVIAVNDCPVQTQAYADWSGMEDEMFLIERSMEVWRDVENDELFISGLHCDIPGFTCEYNESTDELLLSPPQDFAGETTLSILVSDGECESATQIAVSLEAVNDSPVLPAIELIDMAEDETVSLDYQILDPDGPALNVEIECSTPEIQVVWDAERSLLHITSSPDWSGEGEVSVVACDGHDQNPGCDARSFLVHVDPVNDAPMIAPITDKTIHEDESLVVQVEAYDIDSENLSAAVSTSNVNVTASWVLEEGLLSIDVAPDWNGSCEIALRIDDLDGSRTVTEERFQLDVLPVNDIPVAEPCGEWICGPVESLELFRAALDSGDFSLNLADVDNDELRVNWIANGMLVSSTPVRVEQDTLRCWTIPSPPAAIFEGMLTLHVEVTDGEFTLNEGGSECLWELDFLEVADTAPISFDLGSPWPNPFNPATTVPYSLGKAGEVLLSVYDLRGRLVTTLVDGYRSAGAHEAVWSAADAASGIYMLVLEGEGQREVVRATLMK